MEANFLVPPGTNRTFINVRKEKLKPVDYNLYTYTKPNGNTIKCEIIRYMFTQDNGIDFVEIQNTAKSFLEDVGQLTYYVSKDKLIKVDENLLQKVRRMLKWN